MFSLTPEMRYFLCPGKTDMRKGLNSLCGIIEQHMGHKVCHGDVFIFVNRSKTTVKLVHAEDGGLVLYMKRLEQGTFAMPHYDNQTNSFMMDWQGLKHMVDGLCIDSNKRHKRLLSLGRDR